MHGRLIDADALRFEIINKPSEFKATEATIDFLTGLSKRTHEVLDILDESQTIDAVPVVRCRECEYWGDEDGKLLRSDGVIFARCKAHNYLIDGRHTGWCPTENDFCSYGERKEFADNPTTKNEMEAKEE